MGVGGGLENVGPVEVEKVGVYPSGGVRGNPRFYGFPGVGTLEKSQEGGQP